MHTSVPYVHSSIKNYPSSNASTALSTLFWLRPSTATARSLVKSGNIPIKLSTSLSLAPSISGLSVLPEIVSRKFLANGSGGGAVSRTVSLVCRVPDWKMVGSEGNSLRGRRKCFMNAGRRENSHIRPVRYPVRAQIREPGNWERASWVKMT